MGGAAFVVTVGEAAPVSMLERPCERGAEFVVAVSRGVGGAEVRASRGVVIAASLTRAD